ncbi:docking domain of Afi1 for Arf3 in vesicle trafficking-domain-containing protein [Talaromyces proteolyticus]|uniref:Docking domain of Afi1 for Arf3 in vesicle trafficking-domain-containing protein n=1 Tax=Talaromyces proteolyticus TaxID=1131652 RepID=A0AAD4Q2T0_9EURO|nr:docking domain of Afi1 for Arf3 in vesicle trafficking-domain-containing protein [Talaromyces proteolyticus]KAH8700658.1 docking domain of Afi1 for Arf3 in vesicle trafficking-domain-containing protein [Talaromyces proteolyticus]
MANPLPVRTPTGDSQTEKFPNLASFPSSSQLSSNGLPRLSPAASFVRRSPSNAKPTRRRPSVEHPDVLKTGKSRRFKSQYPLDSPERHVEYILVASFHIDRGPIMEHQYPAPISGDESMLAELMLPDQTHVRSQDWTIFFLHKDTGSDDEDDEEGGKKSKKRRKNKGKMDSYEGQGHDPNEQNDGEEGSDYDTDDDDDDDDGSGEGPPLMYVLNLVNTKQDNTVRRTSGAVVKAMAICTRHSFLHIYKPLLLLALEEYFKSPYPETLASLYDAVNAMDLSLLPRFSLLERTILQASDSKDMFIEKFERMIEQRIADDESERISEPSSPDSSSKTRYALPRDTHEYESKVVYNEIPIPVKVPTVIWPETVGDFSLVKLIQIFAAPHSATPQPFALHSHLTTNGAYTHPIIVLINALLTQKRVVFLGHNRPSGEVAEAVLAACALASGGILRGFTRHAFPYTDLTKIDDLLKVPGFVAGVTNPTFANHPEWWDLLCDLPTGRMKISSRIEQAPITEGSRFFEQQNGGSSSGQGGGSVDPTGDVAFMNDILQSISQRYGEGVIRAKWRAYILKFTRVAAAFEESVYGASALYIMGPGEDATYSPSGTKADPTDPASLRGHGYVWSDEASKIRELAASVSRIEGWRNTRSYYGFIQDVATSYNAIGPVKSMDLQHHHDRLRSLKLSSEDAGIIYLALSHAIRDYAGICQLLTVTPESQAGLFYVSLGLLHQDPAVREATADLLDRISNHEAGRHFWTSVGRFTKLAYMRVRRDRDALASPALSTASQGDPFGAPLQQQQSLVGIAMGDTNANRRS